MSTNEDEGNKDQDACKFVAGGNVAKHGVNAEQHSHHGHSHSHGNNGGGHGHTHEIFDGPGEFAKRDRPKFQDRDFEKRSFTVGISGPVGSGKTATVAALCKWLTANGHENICVVTNDIFTTEDAQYLVRNKALVPERITPVETGGCPHAAIREDISLNLLAAEQMTSKFHPELILMEAGGDNLTAAFSSELSDFSINVIDVAGGDKLPRKGGPGITQSDLLVINKTDLAEAVGADLGVMDRDSKKMRGDGPTIFAQVKHDKGVEDIAKMILEAFEKAIPPSKKAKTDSSSSS